MSDFDKNRSLDNINFAKPYFDFIGKGKIYSIFYVVMAFLNLLVPMYVIYKVIQTGFLQNSDGRVVVAFMISWLVITFASVVCFLLWWTRKSNLRRYENADFIATPVISEIIQTMGECAATFLVINGVGIGLIATILLWDIARIPIPVKFQIFNIKNIYCGPTAVLGSLIFGFIIIIFSRFMAELIRICAAIANNTRDIARSLRK